MDCCLTIRFPLKKVQHRNPCMWPFGHVTREEKDYVPTDRDLGDRMRSLFAAKMEKPCLNLTLDSGSATSCNTSSRVTVLAVLNTRREPSKITGMQLRAIHHALKTRVRSGVGLSESLLTRLWLFAAKASRQAPLDKTRGRAARISGPVRHRQTYLCGWNPAT